jgi:DNA-binding NarL/FixJ family response regulator
MKSVISLDRARRVVRLLDEVRSSPGGETGRQLAVAALAKEIDAQVGAAILHEEAEAKTEIAHTAVGGTIERFAGTEDRESPEIVRSVRRVGSERVECLVFARAPGAAPFSDEDRAAVRLFHLEAPSLFAEPRVGLPPRLHHTFEGLLDGAADKDIALRVGLSVHTVREYVKSILRAYGVRSRAELLARHLARGPRPVPILPPRRAGASASVSREAQAAQRA